MQGRNYLNVAGTLPEGMTRSLHGIERFVAAVDGKLEEYGLGGQVVRFGDGWVVTRPTDGKAVISFGEGERLAALEWAELTVGARVLIPLGGEYPERLFRATTYGGSEGGLAVGDAQHAAATGLGRLAPRDGGAWAVGEAQGREREQVAYGAFIAAWSMVVEAARYKQAILAVHLVLRSEVPLGLFASGPRAG